MKKLFLGLLATSALLVFTGCYDTKEAGVTKSAKCGSAKCGDAKKVEKSAKCGAGKCGAGK